MDQNINYSMGQRALDRIFPDRYCITILEVLGSKAKTIPEIEAGRGKKYQGDHDQIKYGNEPVWHERKDLERGVAKILKLDTDKWVEGGRDSNDFQTRITRQIARLRMKEYLVDWNSARRFTIHRLAKPADDLIKDIEKRLLEKERSLYSKTDSVIDSEQLMMNRFVKIILHGNKVSTYKFALARAMLDYCKDNPKKNEIPYKELAALFLKYYWHQAYRFKIKQNFKSDELNVTQIIEEVFRNEKKKRFNDVGLKKKKEVATGFILDSVFGNVRKKKNIVIPAFHTVRGLSDEIFFEYDNEKKMIYLKPGVAQFFHKNYHALLMTTIVGWAKFLEKANYFLPKLVSKVMNESEKRNSLGKYKKMYRPHTCTCFYCNTELVEGKIEVDHFIPWTYMFADDAWNLVLSCKSCNRDKSNALPKTGFKNKLLERNRKYYENIDGLGRSIEILKESGEWEKEIEKHYKRCQEHDFDVWDKDFNEKN